MFLKGESNSAGSRPGCAKWPVFSGDSKCSVALALALLWIRKVKLAGTAPPNRATANPAGQAPSELRQDTWGAGLCLPEFLGSVVGLEDTH
ncbi:UNVERIFIED_CONTAM: hypothetical protein FKN15_017826 [Acipenser sinensis]